jgi:predicted NUDIX family NTP pyrophosphohydrolase
MGKWMAGLGHASLTVSGVPTALATIRQAGGKIVEAFALEMDIDPGTISSNTFVLEWPLGSGNSVSFPEIESARWLSLEDAKPAMLKSQRPLLEALRDHVAKRSR